MGLKQRLVAGTINHWPDDGEWRNWHLDVNPRGIWSRELEMFVQPEFIVDLGSAGDMAIFRDDTFDEVRLHHVLEHLGRDQTTNALAAIRRIVKPGGVLDVEVPNLDGVCRAWVEGGFDSIEALNQWVYGEDLAGNHAPGDTHRVGYSDRLLLDRLDEAGFDVMEWRSAGLAVRAWATPREHEEET